MKVCETRFLVVALLKTQDAKKPMKHITTAYDMDVSSSIPQALTTPLVTAAGRSSNRATGGKPREIYRLILQSKRVINVGTYQRQQCSCPRDSGRCCADREALLGPAVAPSAAARSTAAHRRASRRRARRRCPTSLLDQVEERRPRKLSKEAFNGCLRSLAEKSFPVHKHRIPCLLALRSRASPAVKTAGRPHKSRSPTRGSLSRPGACPQLTLPIGLTVLLLLGSDVRRMLVRR